MPLDTRDKRASALLQDVLPAPDGLTLDSGDRLQAARLYRGIQPLVVLELVDECFTLPPRGGVYSAPRRGGTFNCPVRRESFVPPRRGAVFVLPARREVFVIKDQ